MKKLIAFLIAAVMVLSMLPVMAFTASAAEYAYPDPAEGPWSVYRSPGSYKIPEEGADPSTPTPAPGYKYTSEGFTTIPADYTNMSPWFTVQTSRPVDLTQGFYMQFRVDDFSYKGEAGTSDEWIALTVADSRLASPGSTSHNNYFCSLIRGTGNGSATFESARGVKKTEDQKGSFGGDPTIVSGTVPMDEEGREIYEIEILPTGSGYEVKICGVTVGNPTFVSDAIKALSETYVGLTIQSGEKNGTASMTILKQGTSKADAETPEGTDEAEPEENTLVYGDPIDPSTVPVGEPAALWNTTTLKNPPLPRQHALLPHREEHLPRHRLGGCRLLRLEHEELHHLHGRGLPRLRHDAQGLHGRRDRPDLLQCRRDPLGQHRLHGRLEHL